MRFPRGNTTTAWPAGRRHLRDLPASWRTDQDRRQLIHTARDQFVQAAGIAEVNKDVRRQALAEVAIAVCWLWVPSISDLKIAAGKARKLLEVEIVFGTASRTAGDPLPGDYLNVLKLCKAYGERSAQTGTPAFGNPRARFTVRTVPDDWVECADIWVHVTRSKQAAADASGRDLTVTVINHRPSPVSVGFPQTALVDVSLAGTARPQMMLGTRMAFRAAIQEHGRSSLAPGTKSAWRVRQPSTPMAAVTPAGLGLPDSFGRIEFQP